MGAKDWLKEVESGNEPTEAIQVSVSVPSSDLNKSPSSSSSCYFSTQSLAFQEDDAFVTMFLNYPNPVDDWKLYTLM